MKVILNDYIEHLGERGDTVQVKPGYARNFLLPKGLAYPDTPGHRRRFEQEQKRWEEVDLERKSAAEKMAESLQGVSFSFERRASEKDVLFGSVSVVDIARELAELGFELDRRRIHLDQPIKTLGEFEVEIHVHRDIHVNLPVTVTRPGGQMAMVEEAGEAAEGAEATDAAEELVDEAVAEIAEPATEIE